MDDEEAGFVQMYAVVKNIFSFLGIKDLENASQTCRLWEEIGNIVKSQRPFRSELILFHRFPMELTSSLIQISNFNLAQVDAALLPFMHAWRGLPKIQETLAKIEPILTTRLREMEYFVDPIHLMLLGTKSMHQCIRPGPKEVEYETHSVGRLIEAIGYEISTLAAFAKHGIIYGQPNSATVATVVDGQSDYPLEFMAGLVIPKRSGITVNQFTVRNSDAELVNFKHEEDIKALIVFATETDDGYSPGVKDFLISFIRSHPEAELGGGLILSSGATCTPDETLLASGLLFSGTDQLEVASILLKGSGLSEANKRLMLDFKQKGMEEEGSIAFVFACSGRRGVQDDVTPTELVFFKEKYPRTTLIGAVSEGELHYSNPPVGSKQRRRTQRIFHTFATVIVFVSFPNAK